MKKVLLYFNLTLILSSTVVVPTLSCIPKSEQSLEFNNEKNSNVFTSKKLKNNFDPNSNSIFLDNQGNVNTPLTSNNLNQTNLRLDNSTELKDENKNQSKQNDGAIKFNNSAYDSSESNPNLGSKNTKNILTKQFNIFLNQDLLENDRNNEDSLIKTYYKMPSGIEKQDITISKKIFVRQYEKNIRKKASIESIEKFNQLYDTADNKDRLFNSWEELLKSNVMKLDWEEKINNQFALDFNSKREFRNELLRFYNIMAKIYNVASNNIFNWVNELLISYEEASYCIFNCEIGKITIKLLPDFFEENLRMNYYNCGFTVSSNIIHTVVHEYGHILDKLMFINKEQRLKINQEHVKINVDRWKSTELLIDFLNDKAGIVDEKEKELFPLIVVRSNYGRFWAFEKGELKNRVHAMTDLFAEAFAQWLLTPEHLRGWNWELLNEFFIEEVPKYFRNN